MQLVLGLVYSLSGAAGKGQEDHWWKEPDAVLQESCFVTLGAAENKTYSSHPSVCRCPLKGEKEREGTKRGHSVLSAETGAISVVSWQLWVTT